MTHRGIFVAALLVGVSYWAHHGLPSGPFIALWKGAGVGLLAIWAVLEGRSRDGRVIALVLALGAFGDVLIETHGLMPGAAAFLTAHVLAAWLFLRHRNRSPWWVPILPTVLAVVAWSGHMRSIGLIYALALGTMAGAAAVSRFRLAWIGGLLFIFSDLMIFVQLTEADAAPWAKLLTWPTYYAAQALIAWSVVRGLKDEGVHDRL